MASSVAGAWNYPLQLNNLDAGVTNITVNGLTNPLTSDIQSNSFGLTSTNGMSLVVGDPSFPATTLVTLAPGTTFDVMNDAGFFKTPLSVSYTDVDMRDADNVFAPTVLPADNSERIATTAYVNSAIAGSGGGNMLFSGVSAVGNHVVGTNIPGTNYGPSALNEDASTFNFSTKGLVADSLLTTNSLALTASLDVNINATTINSTAPLRIGVPGSANTYVSTSQVKVQDGTIPNFSNMDINGVEVSNGFDSSKLTFEKLYNNANNATTGSIITIANDYFNNLLTGVTSFTSPGLTLDTPQVDLVQNLTIQSSDDITTNCANYALNATIASITSAVNIVGNTDISGDILTNGNTVAMNTASTFAITADNDISITAQTTTPDKNINLFATGLINNASTDFNVTSTDINLNAVNVNVMATLADFVATPITTTSSTTANSFIKVGGTNLEVLLADGTTAPYNSGGSGGNYFLYESSTNITVPPSISQHVQYNNSVQPSATFVYINHLTDDNIDIDFYLAQVGIGDILYFQDRNLSTNWIKYAVTSRTIIPNDYVEFGVTYVNSEGTGSTNFPNNHPIFFTSYVDSATINTRLNALETKTQYQSTPTLNQTDFTGTVLADTIKITGGLSSNYLMADGSTSALTTITTSGVGTSLVKTGTSPGFELNSLLASTGLSSSLAGDTITLTNTLPSTDISLASTGTGTSLLNSTTNPTFSTKSLAVGAGLSIASTTDTITLTNTGTASTLANAGAGTSLVVSGTAPSLTVKSLSNGTGITLNDVSSNIEIVNSSPASGISLTTVGTGTSILTSTSANPTFSTRTLTAGTNITFTTTTDDIKIDASGGGGGTYTFTNGGTGTTLVSTASTSTDFKPVSITAGTNVTISNSGTDILISSAGVAGGSTLNAVPVSVSASTYYPTFIASGASTTITQVNTDLSGLTYVPSTNSLTAGAMNSVLFTSSNVEPTIGFVGLATTASKIQTTAIPTSASTYYPTFVPTNTSANSEVLSKDVGLTYVPSTNTLATTNFNGTTFTSASVLPTIGFVGASTSASTIQTTGIPSSASIYYITFVPTSTSNNNEVLGKDVGLSYQPSTNALSCDVVNAVTFNSSTPVASAGFVGTCSQALQLATTLQTTNASIFYPIFAPSASTSTGQAMSLDANLSFQPSTNALTCTTFIGALTGTATLATNLVGGTASTNQLLYQTGVNTTALLATGTSGQFLKSNGTSAPGWVDNSTLGFQMSYGGKILLTNDYLTPNRFADTTATSVTASSYLSQWACPVACNITGWSSTVQTTSGATLSILIGGSAGTAIAGVATSTTNSGTITARPVTAGAIVEVRIVGTITNATCVTLYFT